ncbi:MAG: hypothetical protein AB7F88_17035 [Pyrinomonadaceae bacterium]
MKHVLIFVAASLIVSGLFSFLLRWERQDAFAYQQEMLEMCLNHNSGSNVKDLCSHIAYTEIANISREYSANLYLALFIAMVFGLSFSQAVRTNKELRELRKRLDA